MHYLVQSMRAVEAVDDPNAVFWTASPGLEHALKKAGKPVHNPETLIDDAFYYDFCLRFYEHRLEIRERLRKIVPEYADISAQQVYRLFVTLMIRSLVFYKWREAVADEGGVVVGSPEVGQVNSHNIHFRPYDDLFAMLERASFGDDPTRLRPVAPFTQQDFNTSFDYVSFDGKIMNILTRNLSGFAYHLWQRLKCPRLQLRPHQFGIAIYRVNEIVEEAFLPLLFAGAKVSAFKAPKPVLDASLSFTPPDLGPVVEILDHHLKPHVAPQIRTAAVRIAVERVTAAIEYHHRTRDSIDEAVGAWADQQKASTRNPSVLTNSLSAVPNQFLDRMLRKHGITVLVADHGTGPGSTGWVTMCADVLHAFSDLYFAFNDTIRDTWQRTPYPGIDPEIAVTGVPSAHRRRVLSPLLRWMTRRKLGIDRKEFTYVYVGNLIQANTTHGHNTPLDKSFTDYQYKLIETFQKSGRRVVTKPYPAYRYPDKEPIWDLPETGAKVTSAGFGEFRHYRWASDVIVIDLFSSTLSWALTTGKPVILIETAYDSYMKESREGIRDHVFYVDARSGDDWMETLAQYLSYDREILQQKWDAMAGGRQPIVEALVLGPPGPPAAARLTQAAKTYLTQGSLKG